MQYLNCNWFLVNVPVLSEKIKFTFPNSSIIETVFTLQKQCLHLEYNKISHPINIPCINFIISVETIKLIGIKVFNSKKYVKKIMKLSVLVSLDIKIKLS